MSERTFTAEDIRQMQPGISDEEIRAAFDIFEHMGLIRKVVKNGELVYERTEKGKRFKPNQNQNQSK